jgi:hypothetical protein
MPYYPHWHEEGVSGEAETGRRDDRRMARQQSLGIIGQDTKPFHFEAGAG